MLRASSWSTEEVVALAQEMIAVSYKPPIDGERSADFPGLESPRCDWCLLKQFCQIVL